MKVKRKKRESSDNWFVELLSEFSFTLVLEIISSIIWNVILFIPRLLIRLFSNLN